MKQRVIAIHGAGEPQRREGKIYWEPLLGRSLGPTFDVLAPRMPSPEDPRHEPWAARIAALMAEAPRPIMVAHSFGASTLLKLLAGADPQPGFLGVFLVATPFWSSKFPDFALTPAELERLGDTAPLTFYHSQDDQVVDLDHLRRYQRELPSASFHALDGRGHAFDQADFPELVEDIRALVRRSG